MPTNSKKLIGALIAALLAIAVYYGLISRQSADNLQGQANQTLGTTPPSSTAPQPAPQVPAPQNPVPQTPAPTGAAPQNSTPPAQQK